AAQKDGIELLEHSTHRRFSQSEVNYNAKVDEYIKNGMSEEIAKKEAAKLIAPPGYSEHNLGLATDIITKGFWNKYADLIPEFENDPGYTWLIENCAEYGFILRYPKNKTIITGIVYEPWHYRYVGKEAAKFIMDKNLTLEEFVANYTV
ncbi:MAG: M15 family metallopeptidase, partial [Oscillospiraceae bacterium]